MLLVGHRVLCCARNRTRLPLGLTPSRYILTEKEKGDEVLKQERPDPSKIPKKDLLYDYDKALAFYRGFVAKEKAIRRKELQERLEKNAQISGQAAKRGQQR